MDVRQLEEAWAARAGAREARLVAGPHVPAALSLLGGLFLSPALGLHAQAEEISSTQKLRVGYYACTC